MTVKNDVIMDLKMFGWDALDESTGSNANKTEFTKLQNGMSTLRFLDESPFSRWAHWIPVAKRNVTCIGAGCPICEAMRVAKQSGTKTPFNNNRKFAMHVYNHDTNRIEILEGSKTLFAQVRVFHEEAGDIRNYDLKIKTQNAGTTDVMYTIMPQVPTELPEEIKEEVKNLRPFEDIFKVPTREQVIALMNGTDPAEVFGSTTSEEDEKFE